MGSVVKCDVILSTDENVGGQIISNINTEANDGDTQYYCFSKGQNNFSMNHSLFYHF